MRAARALDAEQFEDALCALERALALHPNSEKALALLARTHQRRRKLWDAVRTWGRLYRLAPDRFDPHAGADETVKALPDSAPVLIEALSELPVGSLTVRLMEQLKVEPEYVDQALPVLADFCVQLPASEQCPRAPLLDCEERGWFLARRIVAGALLDVDPARCVAFCEEALSAQADDPLATMLFAGALAQLGRSGEAIERMQAFTERFPGDQAAADLLERLRKFGPSASIA
jgi:tetratricopeptide (TPR) repeat protein